MVRTTATGKAEAAGRGGRAEPRQEEALRHEDLGTLGPVWAQLTCPPQF